MELQLRRPGRAEHRVRSYGLGDPDAVAVAFRSALWYWMNSVHAEITIRNINSALECDGKNPSAINNRVGYGGGAESISTPEG
jgi:chitinase